MFFLFRMRHLHDSKRQHHTINARCDLGGVLLQLWNRVSNSRHFERLTKWHCGFSRSYSYFLMLLYEASLQFPLLGKCAMPVRPILHNWTDIRQRISRKAAFWARHRYVSQYMSFFSRAFFSVQFYTKVQF